MEVTRELARYIVSSRLAGIPEAVRREARRAILNYFGCAIGGSREEAVEIAVRVLAPYAGPGTALVLGRRERVDPLQASFLNGVSSHILEYCDTTPSNYNHPSSPMASALCAYGSTTPLRGDDFLHAFILGFEAQTRIGNATYPAHYNAGWHTTGTVGVFGAAAGIGRLMGLDVPQMIWTIGLAATQSAGLREMFGSMAKAFHPGRSAQSGYLAALLARGGFTSGIHGLEGPRGFAAVTSAQHDLGIITRNLGAEFQLPNNTYKPFPSGIVTHPTIDGCIQLHKEHRLTAADISSVRLRVAPLVLDLCNKKNIAVGLEGKFSVYHCAAIGLVRGKGGIGEFTDETVNDPDILRVRGLVEATGDAAIAEDAVEIEVVLRDGRRIKKRVDHALGNLGCPMTDAELEEKFRDQAARVLPPAQVEEVIALCWEIDKLEDVGRLISAACVK
ncbi:MAG TPA: MmgE/PrpD family protein [Thermodesulfobacteriota bacterium]|nr:MmgE/PrpD family protein [Thermodesulfobacteriota bacterium]